MKKSQLSFIKLIFSAALGAVLYALLMKIFLKTGWNFDIFNDRHWKFVWNKWQHGWVIKGKKDVLFFFLILSFLPGWILTTFAAYSLPLKSFFLFPLRLLQNRKRKKLEQKSLDMARGVNIKRPAVPKAKKPAIPRNDAFDKLRGTKTGVVTQTAQKQDVSVQENEELSEEELHLAHLQRWNDIVTALENQGLFCFRSTKIGNFAVKLTILVKNTVFWFLEGPLTDDEWTLNDDKNPPVWTGNKETVPSPITAAYQARETFKNYLAEKTDYPETAVHAFVVLDNGTVVNPEKVTEELADFDIALLKIPPCEDEELPDMSAMLDYIKTLAPSDMTFNDAVAEAIMTLEED